MLSVSTKQARFMSAAAHSPEFAAKAGIPVSVATEFHNADAGKKYGHTPGAATSADSAHKRRKIAEMLRR